MAILSRPLTHTHSFDHKPHTPQVSVYNNGKWSQHTGVLQAGILLDGAISADGQNCFYTSMYVLMLSYDMAISLSIPMCHGYHIFHRVVHWRTPAFFIFDL